MKVKKLGRSTKTQLSVDKATVANKRRSNLGGIDGVGGKGVERGHVSVFTLHRLLRSGAVVDAAHHFGSHQGT